MCFCRATMAHSRCTNTYALTARWWCWGTAGLQTDSFVLWSRGAGMAGMHTDMPGLTTLPH